MQVTIEVFTLVIALAALVISTTFSIVSRSNAKRAREIDENQKTVALISLLSPACKDERVWSLFLKFLSERNRLPTFTDDDSAFVQEMLERLDIKGRLVNGQIVVEIE